MHRIKVRAELGAIIMALVVAGGASATRAGTSRFVTSSNLQKAAFAVQAITRDLDTVEAENKDAEVRIAKIQAALDTVSDPTALLPDALEIVEQLDGVAERLATIGSRIASTELALVQLVEDAVKQGDFLTAEKAKSLLVALAAQEERAAKAKTVRNILADKVDQLIEAIQSAANSTGSI